MIVCSDYSYISIVNRAQIIGLTVNLLQPLFYFEYHRLWTGPCHCPADVESTVLSLSSLAPSQSHHLTEMIEHCPLVVIYTICSCPQYTLYFRFCSNLKSKLNFPMANISPQSAKKNRTENSVPQKMASYATHCNHNIIHVYIHTMHAFDVIGELCLFACSTPPLI